MSTQFDFYSGVTEKPPWRGCRFIRIPSLHKQVHVRVPFNFLRPSKRVDEKSAVFVRWGTHRHKDSPLPLGDAHIGSYRR